MGVACMCSQSIFFARTGASDSYTFLLHSSHLYSYSPLSRGPDGTICTTWCFPPRRQQDGMTRRCSSNSVAKMSPMHSPTDSGWVRPRRMVTNWGDKLLCSCTTQALIAPSVKQRASVSVHCQYFSSVRMPTQSRRWLLIVSRWLGER